MEWAAPSLQAKSLVWEAENALQGVDEKLTVPWWGQLTFGPPAALIHQQPLGMGFGSWNVLHEVPSPAPPLLPFPTSWPLGAAAPGLEDRRKTAGDRGGERQEQARLGPRPATVGLLINN